MKYTEYTIVATDRSVDARAAADACNRELMAAGDSGNRDAAEVRAEDAAGQPYSHTPGRA